MVGGAGGCRVGLMRVEASTYLPVLESIHLAAYVMSTLCVITALNRRAHKLWSRRDTSPAGVSPSRWGRFKAMLRCLTRDAPDQGSRFLKSAGLILLLFDLLSGVIRVADMSVKIGQRRGTVSRLRSHEYLAGLAVETAWLQGVWLLYTHFTIIACVRRQQNQVTGRLRVPAYKLIVYWLVLGMGPPLLAQSLGIDQAFVRDPVGALGALLGIGSIVYLLWAYHMTFLELEDQAFEAESQGTTYNSESSLGQRSSSHSNAPPVSPPLTPTPGPSQIVPEEGLLELTVRIDPSATLQARRREDEVEGGLSAHAKRVEKHLRRALYRVLEVYMIVFICVALGGIFAGFPPAVTLGGQTGLVLLDLPYALMGWFDAVMVGGMCSTRADLARKPHVTRRRVREDGRLWR